MNYQDHPQSIATKRKGVHFTPKMHQKLIDERVIVIEEVNSSLDSPHKSFTVLGMFKEFAPKSFWVKVRYFYCRDLNNLEWNLLHHLTFTKHLGAVGTSKDSTRCPTAIYVEGKGGELNYLGLVYILTNMILEELLILNPTQIKRFSLILKICICTSM